MSDLHRSHRLPDPDMEAVLPALARAAQRARELARQTGTSVEVERKGKLKEKPRTENSGSGSSA